MVGVTVVRCVRRAVHENGPYIGPPVPTGHVWLIGELSSRADVRIPRGADLCVRPSGIGVCGLL